MFGSVGVDEDIVQVDTYADINQRTQHAFHKALEGGWGVALAKGHYIVDVKPAMCQIRGLCGVEGIYFDLLIAH